MENEIKKDIAKFFDIEIESLNKELEREKNLYQALSNITKIPRLRIKKLLYIHNYSYKIQVNQKEKK